MITENKIEIGNSLIAEFMEGYNDMNRLGILYYDTRIEWIWPVLNKIESLGYDFVISRRGIQIWRRPAAGRSSATDLIIDEDFLDDYIGEQKIKSIWDCCVSFISWYNKSN